MRHMIQIVAAHTLPLLTEMSLVYYITQYIHRYSMGRRNVDMERKYAFF